MSKTEYVVGFLFNGDYNVALIEKNRPAWQRGRWNGIGGHVEPNEKPLDAMRREFCEEAGLDLETWEQYCTVYYTDAVIHFFRAFVGSPHIETKTDENVFWIPFDKLTDNVIPNLHWLIPMALYHDATMQSVEWVCGNPDMEASSQYISK